jgi:hypothetical protein
MDDNLDKKYHTKSLSLIFLIKFFEFPNNELSYMLMFKIFDEETLILTNILNELKNQILSNNNSVEGSLIDQTDSNNPDEKEQNFFNDQSLEEQNETISAMLELMDDYIEKSKNICIRINNVYSYRALYNNYHIFLRGNYNINISNKILFASTTSIEDENSASSSGRSDLIAINSIMDEELIIKNFLNKKIINEFIDFFKELLPRSYKKNKILLIMHTFQNYSIFPIILFSYNIKDNNKDEDTNKNKYIKTICIFLISYYVGLFLSKIINSCFIIKKMSLKTILILSNILLIISLSFPFFNKIIFENNDHLECFVILSRFFIGLSFSNSIEQHFLINYEPKILVVKSIKNFYSIKYISIFFAILYVSLINIFVPDTYFDNKYINKELINESKHELFFIPICFFILIINLCFFRNIKNKDIINNNENEKFLINKNENLEPAKKTIIFERTNSDTSKSSSDEYKSVYSYGKCKIISYKNKRKAKFLDKKYKLFSGEQYEGTNIIFEQLENLINRQNNCCSYINKITIFLVLILISSLINNEILTIFIPLSLKHDEKKIIIILFLPYLLGFISFKLRKLFSNKSEDRISFFNTIVLLLLILELIFFTLIIMAFKFEQNELIISIFAITISTFNVIIEIIITILMNIVIPIEKKLLCIDLGSFIEIFVILFKIIYFILIYFSPFKENILIIFIARFFICICEMICFMSYNYRKNYTSLIRIMNKITYEK